MQIINIDHKNKTKTVTNKNSRIRKVTYEYQGGRSWEDILSTILINYMINEKMLDWLSKDGI